MHRQDWSILGNSRQKRAKAGKNGQEQARAGKSGHERARAGKSRQEWAILPYHGDLGSNRSRIFVSSIHSPTLPF